MCSHPTHTLLKVTLRCRNNVMVYCTVAGHSFGVSVCVCVCVCVCVWLLQTHQVTLPCFKHSEHYIGHRVLLGLNRVLSSQQSVSCACVCVCVCVCEWVSWVSEWLRARVRIQDSDLYIFFLAKGTFFKIAIHFHLEIRTTYNKYKKHI